ncbi:hypothetical protein [Nostoc sp. C117]|uniref:hypothetical protein n=1 Tax=Nostoc sp. C117 TaxID=3349875 RepID=UPI00370D04E9
MKINRHGRAKVLTHSEIQLIFSHGFDNQLAQLETLPISACILPGNDLSTCVYTVGSGGEC